MNNHSPDCGWQFEQYPWECDCGAVVNPEQFKPSWLKAPDGPNRQTKKSKEENR